VQWASTSPDRLSFELRQWARPRQPCYEDVCDLVEVGEASVEYELTLDERVRANVMAYDPPDAIDQTCDPSSTRCCYPDSSMWQGDGPALASFLVDLERDWRRWVRDPIDAGASHDEVKAALEGADDAPFRRAQCLGELWYYAHGSGVAVEISAFDPSARPWELLGIDGVMGDGSGGAFVLFRAVYLGS
jgi:hypothetical protein